MGQEVAFGGDVSLELTWYRGIRREHRIMKKLEVLHTIKGKKFLFAVETSSDKDDYQKYEDLREEIWREPTDPMAGSRNMHCENYFDRGSSLFTGVFAEDEKGNFPRDSGHLVGFSYGFVGVKDKEIGFRSKENLVFYSQYLGVKKEFQRFGMGVLIKSFQRDVVLEVFGVGTITCTFDPLVGVNAFRNIHQFVMEVVEYKEAFYKDFGGELNRIDVPCDRLYVSWDLEKIIQRPEYELEDFINPNHLALDTTTMDVKGRSGSVKIEIVTDVKPDLREEFVLIEIPFDFYKMLKETDVSDGKVRAVPVEWRLRTREAFQKLFQRKYKVIDFRIYRGDDRARDFYVLKK
jgi:predicted GNAT superfamily acetyltransferase